MDPKFRNLYMESRDWDNKNSKIHQKQEKEKKEKQQQQEQGVELLIQVYYYHNHNQLFIQHLLKISIELRALY